MTADSRGILCGEANVLKSDSGDSCTARIIPKPLYRGELYLDKKNLEHTRIFKQNGYAQKRLEGNSNCHRGRGPWIPFIICTFRYFLTFSLKNQCFVTWGRGGQGTDLEGLPTHSSPSSSACLLGFRVAGLEQQHWLWPPALTCWNSIPAHMALVELQGQRSQRSSLSGVSAACMTSPPRDHLWAFSHPLLITSQAACSFHFWAALSVSKLFLIWR